MDSVLIINCGSSSAKLALYAQAQDHHPIVTALAERLVNETGSRIRLKGLITEERMLGDHASHRDAIQAFTTLCAEHIKGLAGIGHRVVHGGEHFTRSTAINDSVLEQLKSLAALAPLHNPANIQGIELCQELFPNVPQVAAFDTSFHHTIPPTTYLYGTPLSWYQNYGVRRYGFHGISYQYVMQETARRLGKNVSEVNLLIAHLGNGCSASAVVEGQSVDCTMGLTPLEGLVMGTRSGDIDPGLIEHMLRTSPLSFEQIMHALNRESGLKGLSGLSNDMRQLLAAENAGNAQAKLAIDLFTFRIARHFAALSANLPHLDALVFTGGIGENAAPVRKRILENWKLMNFQLDNEMNQTNGDTMGRITKHGSPLALVIPTDEERMIALDTYQLTTQP